MERVRPAGKASGDTPSPKASSHKKKKPHFAGVSTPLKRRAQTLAALTFNFFTGLWIIGIVIGLALYFSYWARTAFMVYIAFQVYDQRRSIHPSFRRMSLWFRRSPMFVFLRDYFPIRIVKPRNSVFDPKRNYLFGYHPHGVQATGAFVGFCTEVCNISKLIPGIHANCQTLPLQFKVPLWRELTIWSGAGDASKNNILQQLRRGPGYSTCIVVGGAAESLYAAPNSARLVLRNRKGFVKIAMSAGADLVPVYAFGENDVYHNLAINRPGLLQLQRRIQKMLTFAPLLVQGRGVFTYSGGLVPYRRPIFIVLGNPIHVEKSDNPDKEPEKVDMYHAKYMSELKALFEKYRPIFDPEVNITFE
jgi:hypothetical protein